MSAAIARWPVPGFGPARETIPGRTHALSEGDAITVVGIGLELSVLDMPGHTAGHIAYVARDAKAPLVFCGDPLFALGCGRLFEGTPPQMVTWLGKLAALAGPTRVYCGHECTLANLRFARTVEPGQCLTPGAPGARAAEARPRRAHASLDNRRGAGDEPVPADRRVFRARRGGVACGARACRPRRSLREIRAWKNAF
jgi:hydroxyacylglutathione hydrolase